MKYKLTEETKEICGRTLHRIVCVTAFASVYAGDVGGWIESEKNLSQDGDAWVYGDAEVYDNARVYGNARVYDNAWVYDNAEVYGNARVSDNAWVYGNARVYGDAEVSDNAKVCGNARVKQMSDYIVLKNCWGSGRYFTYTTSNGMWSVGCFHGTGEELIKKAYSEGELKGKCYEASVKYVQEIMKLIKEDA